MAGMCSMSRSVMFNGMAMRVRDAWRAPLGPPRTSVRAARTRGGLALADARDMDEDITIKIGELELAGTLAFPQQAKGLVVFAHGSGSSRHSPRNRHVAAMLQGEGL